MNSTTGSSWLVEGIASHSVTPLALPVHPPGFSLVWIQEVRNYDFRVSTLSVESWTCQLWNFLLVLSCFLWHKALQSGRAGKQDHAVSKFTDVILHIIFHSWQIVMSRCHPEPTTSRVASCSRACFDFLLLPCKWFFPSLPTQSHLICLILTFFFHPGRLEWAHLPCFTLTHSHTFTAGSL